MNIIFGMIFSTATDLNELSFALLLILSVVIVVQFLVQLLIKRNSRSIDGPSGKEN
jgi:hypothetical protein